MKILCSGDEHFDEQSRFDECIYVHDFMVNLAREYKVDAYVCCGDVYERASTPKERAAVASFLIRMAEVCPVFIVKGNHDRDLDCSIMGKLRSKHEIVVEESAGVAWVGNAILALVAWPQTARVMQAAATLGAPPTDVALDALRSVFLGLAESLRAHKGPKIACGHFMVDGSVTSVGQPLVGMPIRVGLADLQLIGADMVVMGHIHKPQDWQIGSTPILYTGSPYRTTYGEIEEKSVVIVDAPDDGSPVTWERIPTPCAAMYLVTDAWENGAFVAGAYGLPPAPEDIRGAEIRFRYSVEADQRVAAAAAATRWKNDWLELGAADVQVEDVVSTVNRARAPEVAAAQTTADKLRALWCARETIPEPARAERLITMASELESETQ